MGMGRRKRIAVSLCIVVFGMIATQVGAFSIGVLLGSPDRTTTITFWALLSVCFVLANLACLGLLKLWAEPWARRRLRHT